MRYLIIPRLDLAALEIGGSAPQPAFRARFREKLREFRVRHDQAHKTIKNAIDRETRRLKNAGAQRILRVLASPDRQMVATGITVIEADEASANNLGDELAEAVLVQDDSMNLIAPMPVTGDIAAAQPAAGDDEMLWHLKQIGLEAARKAGFAGSGHGVTAAVLDTGVADVPELAGRVVDARELDLDGWRARKLDKTTDTHGHGTMVAGLIAGRTVGVAPGASLVNVIMLPGSYGTLSGYVLALEWVASQTNISVVNISAGQSGFHPNMQIMTEVLRRVHVLTVSAIGNEGKDETRSPGNYPNVISVGACNSSGGVWSRSGGGSVLLEGRTVTAPKLVAPGEAVTTCTKSGEFSAWSGTSLAAPIVTGLACLLLERWPELTLAQLEAELLDHAESLNLPQDRQGAGRAKLSPKLLS
jgi:subtilisin family serine protease